MAEPEPEAPKASPAGEAYRDASAGVDNLMNALIDKAALITKHWKLTADTGPFYLTVRHYSMTKLYILSISGLLVLVNSKVVYRHTDPIEDKLEVPFTLSGKTGKLVIEATAETKDKKSKVFTYTLFYGSDERRADFLTDGTPGAYPEAADSCSVKAGAPQEVDGSSVQFYDLSTTVDGRARSVPKRFKEFDNLQRLVRSAYAESDELANIPRLPSKTFGRKGGDEFVEKRRAGLEEFIKGALRIPHMTSNPDVLHFIGLLSEMPGANSSSSMPESQPVPEAAKQAAAAAAADDSDSDEDLFGGGSDGDEEEAEEDDDAL